MKFSYQVYQLICGWCILSENSLPKYKSCWTISCISTSRVALILLNVGCKTIAFRHVRCTLIDIWSKTIPKIDKYYLLIWEIYSLIFFWIVYIPCSLRKWPTFSKHRNILDVKWNFLPSCSLAFPLHECFAVELE